MTIPLVIRAFLALQCLFTMVSASGYYYTNSTLRQIMPNNWDLELTKRQVTPAEPCVQFEAQVPCDFESCCAAGMLCSVSPGGVSFVCVPAGAVSCPTNTLQCTDGSGCCPVGTVCTGDGHCKVNCTPDDPVCGMGCCPTRFGIECNQSTGQCIKSSSSESTSPLTVGSITRVPSTRAATTARGSSSATVTVGSSASSATSSRSSGAVNTLVSLINTSIAFLLVACAV